MGHANPAAEAQQAKGGKKVVTDEELIRQLRLDAAAGLYPGVESTKALLRAYDKEINALAIAAPAVSDLLARAESAEGELALVKQELAQFQTREAINEKHAAAFEAVGAQQSMENEGGLIEGGVQG